jgi:hypothetical protein
MQEFSRVDPEYIPPDAWNEGMSLESAQHLHNFGHDKLVEDVHGQSVWTVLPIENILGKLLLAPWNGTNAWTSSEDAQTSRCWWTLPMASTWARDKGYAEYR